VVGLSSTHRQISYRKYSSNNDQNEKQETCKSIDVASTADRNIVQKEAEKQLEYKSIWIEIQRMWNKECSIIPVIYSANRTLTEVVRKNLETTAGKLSIDSIQKRVILGTSHEIWKVL
jgi:hypothetical protein